VPLPNLLAAAQPLSLYAIGAGSGVALSWHAEHHPCMTPSGDRTPPRKNPGLSANAFNNLQIQALTAAPRRAKDLRRRPGAIRPGRALDIAENPFLAFGSASSDQAKTRAATLERAVGI